VIENDHRHFFEPQLLRRKQAAVARDDTCIGV
jgi:hypothetical protein